VEFQVGDWVWLRLNHRVAAGIRSLGQTKLEPKYFGPYAVLEKIGAVAYRLQLPPSVKIHNVFHVVFLKKFEGAPQLNRRRCHQLSGEERLPSLIVWFEHGQRDHLGNCWSDGKDAVWLRPLEQFKEDYLDVKLEDELFRQGGQCCGLLWSSIRKKEQAGPQPELVKIELSLLVRCGPLRPIRTLVIRLYKHINI
jgi:hypothetical protein